MEGGHRLWASAAPEELPCVAILETLTAYDYRARRTRQTGTQHHCFVVQIFVLLKSS